MKLYLFLSLITISAFAYLTPVGSGGITSVATVTALPVVGNTIGTCNTTKDTGILYCWNGFIWAVGGGAFNTQSLAMTYSASSPQYANAGVGVLAGNTGAFSVAAWMYPATTWLYGAAVSKDDTTSGNTARMFDLIFAQSGTTDMVDAYFFVLDNIHSSLIGHRINTFALNAWHFLVGTYDGGSSTTTSAKLYVDGVLSTTTYNAGSFTGITSTAGAFLIGANVSGVGTVANLTNGNIDQVAVWSGVVLSAAAVADLYSTTHPKNLLQATTNYNSTDVASLTNWWVIGEGLDSRSTIFDIIGGANATISGSPYYSTVMP